MKPMSPLKTPCPSSAPNTPLLLPLELIVVARLHHLVALAEGGIAAHALVFAGSGGVEFRLQKLVEHPYAAFALLGRAEHLHLPDGIEVQEARQAGGAERDDALRRVGRGRRRAQRKKSLPFALSRGASPRLMRWAL